MHNKPFTYTRALRKVRALRPVAVALLGAALTLAGPPALPFSSTALAATVESQVPTLNIRSGPGLGYSLVGTLHEDDAATLLKREGDWLQIRLGGGLEGWVAGWLASVSEKDSHSDGENSPSSDQNSPSNEENTIPGGEEAATGEPSSPQVQYVEVTASLLNVRSGPNTNVSVIEQLPRGTRVVLTGGNAAWRRVRLASGKEGWVSGEYVALIEPLGGGAGTATGGGETGAGEAAEGSEVPPVPVTDFLVDPERKVVVTASSAALRNGPSLNYSTLTYLPRGTELRYLDSSEGWVRVATGGGSVGWIHGSIVAVQAQVPAGQALEYVVEPGRWRLATTEFRTVTASALNLRAEPTTGSSVEGLLTQGTSVSVLDRQGNWLEVSVAGQRGWVASQYTSGAAAPSRLRSVELTGQGDSHLQLEVLGDLSAANIIPVPQERGLALTFDNQMDKQGLLDVNSRGVESLSISSAGIWVAFAGRPGYTVVENQPGRLVLDIHPVIERVWSEETDAGQVLRLQMGGALDARVETLTGLTRVRLIGAEWQAGSNLPDGVRLSRVGEDISLDVTTDRPVILKRGDGVLSIVTLKSGVAGKTIVIDPGHGGDDPGALALGGGYERDLNLAVARRLATILEQAGAKVLLTRADNGWVAPESVLDRLDYGRDRIVEDLDARSELANGSRADLFISIHHNAGSSGERGTETYWGPGNLNRQQSLRLAGLIQNELVATTRLPNRGVKGQIFYVIQNAQAPSVLVELGFLSNWTDVGLLKTAATQEAEAQAIYRALQRFFE